MKRNGADPVTAWRQHDAIPDDVQYYLIRPFVRYVSYSFPEVAIILGKYMYNLSTKHLLMLAWGLTGRDPCKTQRRI